MRRHEKIKPHLEKQYKEQKARLSNAAYYAHVVWNSPIFNNNWRGTYFTVPIEFKKPKTNSTPSLI